MAARPRDHPNVLVTGGAGFIGANLARHLVESDQIGTVRVLDDLSTGRLSNLEGADVEFYEGSILDRDRLGKCLSNVSAVVHLAARPSVPLSVDDPQASHDINVNGTMSVMEMIRQVDPTIRVIFASSSSVYGANPALPKHVGLAPRPVSPYAASKLAAESIALAHQATYGIPVLAFRFFNVFGPLQPADHAYAAVVPAFVDAAVSGRPIPIHGDGLQTRDFTYVDTVTQVIHQAIVREVDDDLPVNLAFGSRTDLLEVVRLLEEVMGHDLKREHLPVRSGDVRDSQADDSEIRRHFSEVEPIALIDGLRQTVAWFQES